ncbi:uncharacterized protein PV07_12676 [Cladophialophora immunda]|uniref:Uncharacterized protein n=1 Tax=Cladophialophora immunda TaxID=569365 RepID=A0A0D2CEE5_9EURO|nr:uncharacterized protein PV07_12676 [Cladophialophora immunda]KIW21914.1 hypothetical protein PV07_12676 [Cladophialophora immunda]
MEALEQYRSHRDLRRLVLRDAGDTYRDVSIIYLEDKYKNSDDRGHLSVRPVVSEEEDQSMWGSVVSFLGFPSQGSQEVAKYRAKNPLGLRVFESRAETLEPLVPEEIDLVGPPPSSNGHSAEEDERGRASSPHQLANRSLSAQTAERRHARRPERESVKMPFLAAVAHRVKRRLDLG